MASDQPYNALGQILSEGGEIALGLAMLQDMPKEGFLLFFRKRFEPITDDDRGYLMSLSAAMVEAGKMLQEMPAYASMRPEDVPINEWLFGGSLEGRRLLITGEVELPGAGGRVQIRMPFSDFPTMGEVQEAFLGRGIEIASQYPEKFGLTAEDIPTEGNVYILLPERAF